MKPAMVEPARQETCERRGGKYLTCYLAGEEYGIPIHAVHEILPMMELTPVPHAPEYVLGVFNLRGQVLSIVDLRMKFGLPPEGEPGPDTCLIVVEANGIRIGVVVDQVCEVLEMAEEDIVDPPLFGPEFRTDFLLGIGKANGQVRLLLDMDRVLARRAA